MKQEFLEIRPAPRVVIFDFDYTLADSSRAVVDCANSALTAMSLPKAGADEIRKTIGLSLVETFARLAGAGQTSRAEEFRRHFRRRSDQIMVDWTVILPGVADALGVLRRRGFRLAIVSTKFRFRIRDTLARESLAEHFETIVGGDDVTAFKPDPAGLRAAVGALEVEPNEALYVGDSLTDAETAERGGVDFVAVLSGLSGESEFSRFPKRAVLSGVAALPAWLERFEREAAERPTAN